MTKFWYGIAAVPFTPRERCQYGLVVPCQAFVRCRLRRTAGLIAYTNPMSFALKFRRQASPATNAQ